MQVGRLGGKASIWGGGQLPPCPNVATCLQFVSRLNFLIFVRQRTSVTHYASSGLPLDDHGFLLAPNTYLSPGIIHVCAGTKLRGACSQRWVLYTVDARDNSKRSRLLHLNKMAHQMRNI